MRYTINFKLNRKL